MSPPEPLWRPTEAWSAATTLRAYMQWLVEHDGPRCADYHELWDWSVDDVGRFWASIAGFFDVRLEGVIAPALSGTEMPGVRWFPNTRLNYCEQVFRHAPSDVALIACAEDAADEHITYGELLRRVAMLADTLRTAGVGLGDRVAGYLPNRVETVVSFLATASLGAVWACCPTDMGPGVVIDRLAQIEPKVLIATESCRYHGRIHDKTEQVVGLLSGLPSVQTIIHVPGPLWRERGGASPCWLGAEPWPAWSDAGEAGVVPPLRIEPVPFDHPLWIVFSSGTTGLPKGIVHSHGGITLTHLKTLALQHDFRVGDRLLFLGSPGWIVWNFMVGGLLLGGTVVLYDGHPNWPDEKQVWQMAERLSVSHLGCGAAWLVALMRQQLRPSQFVKLDLLRTVISTGSPLPDDAFAWVYRDIKPDLWLASVSGGTDIASGFVACCPLLPVDSGEIQCRELGVAAYAFDEDGQVVVGAVGELVVVKPMPSMPICLWGDATGQRYQDSYFDVYPGVWRHGDWIRFTERGSSVIYGRSDATINRHGVRIGTAEIYRAIESLDSVTDSLVVDLEYLGRESFMPLFVVLNEGVELTEAVRSSITQAIRATTSARHIPDDIIQILAVPRTLTGKKLEVPIRKLLLGAALDTVVDPENVANPSSLDFFVGYASQLQASAQVRERPVSRGNEPPQPTALTAANRPSVFEGGL